MGQRGGLGCRAISAYYMGVKPWYLLLLFVPAYGYLLYWSATLSDDLARLELRLSSLAEAEPQPGHSQAAPAGAAAKSAATPETMELAELRAEVKRLQAEVDAAKVRKEMGTTLSSQRILDVVDTENERILDKQLDFHRQNWVEFRETTLMDFTRRFDLTLSQQDKMEEVLIDEIDDLVELLKRPELRDDPDRAATDWVAVLEATDGRVGEVLDPKQLDGWKEARRFERAILFPWLPE